MRRYVVLVALAAALVGSAATQIAFAQGAPETASGIRTVAKSGVFRVFIDAGIDVNANTKVVATVISGNTNNDIVLGVDRHFARDRLVIRFSKPAVKGLKLAWLAWNGDAPGDIGSLMELEARVAELERLLEGVLRKPSSSRLDFTGIDTLVFRDGLSIVGDIRMGQDAMGGPCYPAALFFDGRPRTSRDVDICR